MKALNFLVSFLVFSSLAFSQNQNKCLIILNDKDCINCNRALWGISQINARLDPQILIPVRMESFVKRLLTEVSSLPEKYIKLIINDSLYEAYASVYPRTTLLVTSPTGKVLYHMPFLDILNNSSVVNVFSNSYHELDTLASLAQHSVSQSVKLYEKEAPQSAGGFRTDGLHGELYLLDELFGDIWKMDRDSFQLVISQSKLNVDSLRRRYAGEWNAELDSARKYDHYLKFVGYDRPTIQSLYHHDTKDYAFVRCPLAIKVIENDKVFIDVGYIHLMVPFSEEFNYTGAIPLLRRLDNAFELNDRPGVFWRDNLIYFTIFRSESQKAQETDPILCAMRVLEENRLEFSHFLPMTEPLFFSENGLKNELNGRYIRNGKLFYVHAPQTYDVVNAKTFPLLNIPVKNRVLADNSWDFPLFIRDFKVIQDKLTLLLASIYDKKSKSSRLVMYYFNTETGSLIDEREILFYPENQVADALINSNLDVSIFSESKYLIRIK